VDNKVTPERWAQIEELFHRVAESDPTVRQQLLDRACSGDPELRKEVEALLACDGRVAAKIEASVCSELQILGFPLSGKTVSHYHILGGLGSGGMGLVYRAKDVKLPREVAIKFLPEESSKDANALRRFEREARSASALEHANICPIYEFGEHEGQPFIVMPVFEGQTLEQCIHTRGAPKGSQQIQKVLDLSIQVLKGLGAAHEHGIVHRDIKPGNIFLTSSGEAKILDFGVAKLTEEEQRDHPAGGETETVTLSKGHDLTLSRTGAVVGTAAYMSPEQVRGEKVDSRTDVFSFGLVLYELSTGERAFGGTTWPVIQEAVLRGTPKPVRGLNPEVPTKLENIINKAIEKDREARYQTATEMRADLEELQRLLAPKHLPRAWVVGLGAACLIVIGIIAFLLKRQPHTISVAPEIKLHQLTTNSSENPVLGDAISPDGKYLVYTDLKGMHIKVVETGETRAVPQPEALKDQNVEWGVGGGAWFPDGTRFLASSRAAEPHWNDWSSENTNMWVTSVLGGAPRKLRDHAMDGAVSPDGSLVSFDTNKGKFGEREIWVMGSNGEQARKFDEAKEGSGIENLGWSPDGKHFAYILNDNSGRTMLSRDVKGGPLTILFRPSEMKKMTDINFLRDGRVVYALQESDAIDSACNYWTMQLDLRTGKPIEQPRRLTNWGGFCAQGGSTTADGKRLAFVRASSQWTVYIADLLTGGTRIANPQHFGLDDSFNVPQDWTNDSKAVIFTSNRTGQFAIYKQSLNEDAPERISAGTGNFLDTPVTPDGKWVFGIPSSKPDNPKDPVQIMRIPLAGGSPESVTTALANPTTGIVCARPPSDLCVLGEKSEDRKHLIFASIDPLRGRGPELARFDLDPNIEFIAFDVSPDGTQLAISGNPKGPIYILPLHGGKAQVIQARFNDMQPFFWARDGKGFYIADRTKRGAVLSYMNLHGNAHILWEIPGSPWTYARPSPDGRHLAIATSSISNNLWMMENF
jgi:serine/threonine protein kinase/Tol biopolymer transport system component